MIGIERVLRREHGIAPGAANDFNIRNRAEFLSTAQETTQTFTFLLAGIAAVSLVVGGIGIMNIMLVSVTERTREIGVRKALGATRRNIMLQFLVEAVTLCMLGGVAVVRHDHRYLVADEPHELAAEERQVLDVAARERTRDVRRGDDRPHARYFPRTGSIDGHDARMRQRAADVLRPQGAGRLVVGGVAGAAAHLVRALDARERPADDGEGGGGARGHGRSPG